VKQKPIYCLLLTFILAGCATEPTQYYLLDSRAPAVSTENSNGIWLGIKPVTLPEYLDRMEIVTRATAHRLNVAVFDVWAEPLETNTTNVLADALAQLVHTDRIVLLANESANTDYNLGVDIERFERQPDGTVLLAAEWTIEHAESGAPEIVGSANIHESITGKGYDAIVAAMSRALYQLSDKIAAEVGELKPADSIT
jgi:uncharacterized lipoprotein YmbA